MFGDCLWVDYGEPEDLKVILIDAGTAGTWKPLLQKIKKRISMAGPLVIELFVITHVDRDHIGGAIKFMENLHQLQVTIRDVWFNGWHHLNGNAPPEKCDQLGALDGERLSALLLDSRVSWNGRFKRQAVVVPDTGELPSFDIGGMRITLLSPNRTKLDNLVPVWIDEVANANLVPGDAFEVAKPPDILGSVPVEVLAGYQFKPDTSEANGSSIAFLATFENKSVLFGADAHSDLLKNSLDRVKPPLVNGVDVLKMSHHGSKGNTDNALVSMLKARHYLVSTNGSIYHHPDDEAIARVLKFGPSEKVLYFNYEKRSNSLWVDEASDYGCEVRYGDEKRGLVIDL
jgi:beta-lactamase superfamily II metal-dependent hydrolase